MTADTITGVLDRQESLAANLGAKLTGPRLLRGIDKFFEGPIRVNSSQPFSHSIGWLDICMFAKTNPNEFVLTTLPDGSRCCQFAWKGLHVEIGEDDWRFISSGALNRIPLEHPLEEDETAEIATLEILEQRTSILYKKADEVAARARILHHKLGLRQQEIARRRDAIETPSGSAFQSINHPRRPSNPGPGPAYDIHADLLQQFTSNASLSTPHSRPTSRLSISSLSGQRSPPLAAPQPHRMSAPSRASTAASSDVDTQVDIFRPLITQKIDKLTRGDPINPPCDRCRRLKLQCVKHLTACQGCTKKHARCSWKALGDEEIGRLRRDLGIQEGEIEGESERELVSPQSSLASGRRTSDVVLAPIASTEGSRPASRGGEQSSASTYGIPSLLSNRIDLPPVRMRTSLPQGHATRESPAGTPPGPTPPGQYPPTPGFAWGSSNSPAK